VVRRGLAPLAHLAARAEQVTARRLGARLALEEAPREVHGLADSLNAMLERLEESFRALEQFSADIAHELRTPINLWVCVLVVHRLESRTSGLASPCAPRCAGRIAHRLGRNQPVIYIRHSVRFLLDRKYLVARSLQTRSRLCRFLSPHRH
jgi:hypothetical protein